MNNPDILDIITEVLNASEPCREPVYYLSPWAYQELEGAISNIYFKDKQLTEISEADVSEG